MFILENNTRRTATNFHEHFKKERRKDEEQLFMQFHKKSLQKIHTWKTGVRCETRREDG